MNRWVPATPAKPYSAKSSPTSIGRWGTFTRPNSKNQSALQKSWPKNKGERGTLKSKTSGCRQLPKPDNPNFVAYLTPDEEKLVCSFLQTCNYMHMPFNRDAFKVSVACACLLASAHQPYCMFSDLFVRLQSQTVVTVTRLLRTSTSGSFWRAHRAQEFQHRLYHRAKQATTQVRDAVFDKLQVFSL